MKIIALVLFFCAFVIGLLVGSLILSRIDEP